MLLLSFVFTLVIFQVCPCQGQQHLITQYLLPGQGVTVSNSAPRADPPAAPPAFLSGLPSLANLTSGRVNFREMLLNLVDMKIRWLRDLRSELRVRPTPTPRPAANKRDQIPPVVVAGVAEPEQEVPETAESAGATLGTAGQQQT